MLSALLAFAEILSIPLIASFLSRSVRLQYRTWFIIGLLMFLYSGVNVLALSIISWAFHPGHTKGIEVSLIDILAAALFLVQKRQEKLPKPPMLWPMAIYLVVCLLSIINAQIKIPVFFYCCQIARVSFLYIVVYRASADLENLRALAKGWALGLILEFALVIFQRFVMGQGQPSGSFAHRNALGYVSNLVFLSLLPLSLSYRSNWIGKLSMLAGFITPGLLASRATFGLGIIGTVLNYLASLMNGFTARKAMTGIMGLIAVIILVIVGNSVLDQRAATELAQSSGSYDDYDERQIFISATSAMLSEHPFGVGANNYVIVANLGGYYERFGVAAVDNSRSAHVHNLYWLTLGELGYPGLAALLWLLLQPLLKAIGYALKYRGTFEARWLSGLAISLLITCIHNNYEWIGVTAISQYFVFTVFGLVAGLSYRLEKGMGSYSVEPFHQGQRA